MNAKMTITKFTPIVGINTNKHNKVKSTPDNVPIPYMIPAELPASWLLLVCSWDASLAEIIGEVIPIHRIGINNNTIPVKIEADFSSM